MNKIKKIFEEVPILTSSTYRLRTLEFSDHEAILAIYSDEETLKYQAMDTMKCESDAMKNLEMIKSGYENKYFVRWGIINKEDNTVIGLIALHHIDYRSNHLQIGYILNKCFWNKKIMTNTVSDTIDYLFKEIGLHRLVAEIHPENIASIKLSEKLGFKKEGDMIDSSFNPLTNKYEDRIMMSLINEK